MTATEINSEISSNIEKITKAKAEIVSNKASRADWQQSYDKQSKKDPYKLQTVNLRTTQIDRDEALVKQLEDRNVVLNNQLGTIAQDESRAKSDKAERDLIESKAKAESEKKLADKGLTPESILADQKAKAKVEEDLAKAKADVDKIKATAEADILKVKSDYELAQRQKADNEMAVKMAKESAPKGMNPILKISLIALGVAGVMIGGFLLVKKK